MSEKTKKYGWLPWAVALAIAVALFLITSNFVNWYFLSPWSPAKIATTKIAINEFGAGVADTAPYWYLRLSSLLAIVLTFVLGPSLWIFAEIRNQSSSSDSVIKKGLLWYAGVIMVIISLQVVPATITKGLVFNNTWKSAAKSENADELRSHLAKLAFDAYEQYYLPQKLGGGSGSFRNIPGEDGNMRSIGLTDLDNYNQDTANSYVLAPVTSDSVITIYGIGNKQGPDPDFENANGRKGKIQIAVKVAPPDDFEFSNSNN